jgi:hypothetical protein
MTMTITLPIETEEFTALLKSIQTRLNNLDDKKTTPIIKEKKMPFIPNMLVDKMIMMARPTYPYLDEIKHILKWVEEREDKPEVWDMPYLSFRPKNWFFNYHYWLHYDFHNDHITQNKTEFNLKVFKNIAGVKHLVSSWYKDEFNMFPLFMKPGMADNDEEDQVQGSVKKYKRKKAAVSVFKWIYSNAPGKTKFSKKGYDEFKECVSNSIKYEIKRYTEELLAKDDVPFLNTTSEIKKTMRINKKNAVFFIIKVDHLPLQIKAFYRNNRVYITEIKNTDTNKTYAEYYA